MKKNIHPQYFPKAKIICACGNEIETGSTKEEIKVELCSNCHPFFTGKQKLVDTARRVEKFQDKVAKADTKITTGKKIKRAKRAKQKADKKAKVKVEN